MVQHSLPRPPATRPKVVAERSRRRPPSPPSLPPTWGQAVAPPPTPYNVSPPDPRGTSKASPIASEERAIASDDGPIVYRRRRDSRRHGNRRHRCNHTHHQVPEQRVRRQRSRPSSRSSLPATDLVTYTYRFSDTGIYREALPPTAFYYGYDSAAPDFLTHGGAGEDSMAAYADCESEVTAMRNEASLTYLSPRRRLRRPSPEDSCVQSVCRVPMNSQSSSPVYTNTTGSSPEAPLSSPPATFHHTSPVSPTEWTLGPMSSTMVKSALRPPTVSFHLSASSIRVTPPPLPKPTKTVQWLSDVKRRAEDISTDRKVVKYQVS